MKLSFSFMALFLAACLLLTSCLATTPRSKAGAKIGAIVGVIGGAAIDDDNPWRGGVIGLAAGAILGSVIGDIVDQAAEEAAFTNKPVAYQRATPEGGWERLEAKPLGISDDGMHRIVSVKHVQDGVVVKEEISLVPLSER